MPILFLITLASIIGIISPMPVYVVIPLIVILFKVGIPAPVLFSYLISSPLMNPVIFSLTAGALGLEMAIARSVSALSLGISAGYALFRFNASGRLNCIFSEGAPATEKRKYCYEKTFASFIKTFLYESYRLFFFAGKYFVLGILTAAAVKTLIPATFIIKRLGNSPSVSILLAVAAGVPLYACGGGTIPVMKILLGLGMNKGAILAFFISGPATKISTLVTLNAAIKREAFMLYLIIAFTDATVFGFFYNTLN